MIRHLGAIKTEYGQMVQALSLIKGIINFWLVPKYNEGCGECESTF